MNCYNNTATENLQLSKQLKNGRNRLLHFIIITIESKFLALLTRLTDGSTVIKYDYMGDLSRYAVKA